MHVAKLRARTENGLVPAGRFFQQLANDLRDANARDAARQAEMEAEDRELEALYRRSSGSRANVYAEAAA
jgi:hypothetical protein